MEERVAVLCKRISDLDIKLEQLEYGKAVERVKGDLRRSYCFSFQLVTVDDAYYQWSLEQRAKVLGVSEAQLCKTLLFVNTAADHDSLLDMTNSKFYAVVVQYKSKFNAEKMRDFIHSLRPVSERLSKRKFHFQLAGESDSNKLTGYLHNAVTPFGMRSEIPVVICSSCCELSYIYLGGGEVNVKLGISTADFKRITKAFIGNVSDSRELTTSSFDDD